MFQAKWGSVAHGYSCPGVRVVFLVAEKYGPTYILCWELKTEKAFCQYTRPICISWMAKYMFKKCNDTKTFRLGD